MSWIDGFMIDGADRSRCFYDRWCQPDMVLQHEADVDVMVDGFMIDGASGDGANVDGVFTPQK